MINSRITEVEKLSQNTSTIRFKWDQHAEAGQFIMVWVPGAGEIPISLSHLGNEKGITVRSYGVASEALIKKREGERLFFRGPYGRPFTKVEGRKLIIGGGSGMAGLLPLIDEKSHGIVAARTKSDLLFHDRFPRGHVTVVTDDGSAGIKGLAVDGLKGLRLEDFDVIYACGPEMMLKSILDRIRDSGVRAEFSLERIMKCGIGICDSCSIDGHQLCTEGPTFSLEEIASMREFGVTRLTESGRRIWLGKH